MTTYTIRGNYPHAIAYNHNGSTKYLTRLDYVHNGVRTKVWELMPASLSTFTRTFGSGGSYIEFRNATRNEMGYMEDEPYGKYSCVVYAKFVYAQNQVIQTSSSMFRGIVLTSPDPESDSGLSGHELSSFSLGSFAVSVRIYSNTSATGSYRVVSAQMVKSSNGGFLGFADWASFKNTYLSGMSAWSLTPDGTSTTVSKSGISALIIK